MEKTDFEVFDCHFIYFFRLKINKIYDGFAVFYVIILF